MKRLIRYPITAMTRSGAIAKAKKYAERIENMSVVRRGDDYEVTHTDYLQEWLDDGWEEVASYKYENTQVVKCKRTEYDLNDRIWKLVDTDND